MKRTYKLLSLIEQKSALAAIGILMLGISACTKQTSPAGTSSLILVNTVVGADILVTNFEANTPLTSYAAAANLNYGVNIENVMSDNSNRFNVHSGTKQLALYKYPDTTAHSSPLLSLTLNLPVGSMNSLFLTGTADAPESFFTKDELPYHSIADSTAGLRFVNLSPGSAPISINLKDQPTGSETGSLPYKSITTFKNYAATSNTGNYIFEFRNAATGALITTYSITDISKPGINTIKNTWLFRNNTLILIGLPGVTIGKTMQKIIRVQHE